MRVSIVRAVVRPFNVTSIEWRKVKISYCPSSWPVIETLEKCAIAHLTVKFIVNSHRLACRKKQPKRIWHPYEIDWLANVPLEWRPFYLMTENWIFGIFPEIMAFAARTFVNINIVMQNDWPYWTWKHWRSHILRLAYMMHFIWPISMNIPGIDLTMK